MPPKSTMSMNRHNQTSTPCSTSTPNDIDPPDTTRKDIWPRFLIMEAADENIPLDMDEFVLKKAIDGMANGVPKKVKRLKSGCIFIIVDQKHQSQNLLRTTKLMNHYPVKVSPHKYLNSTKCVIQSRELNNMEESYIAEELRSQGVIAVKRISVRYDLYCLTINGQTIPEHIDIGYLKARTRPYIPNPQRCFQCHKFGHTKNSCKGKAVCAGCGEEGHVVDDCDNEPKCVNCEGDHYATSKDCPKWDLEKRIIKLKYTEKISFADARKRVQPPTSDPSKNSYATATKTPQQSTRPQQPWARNIRSPTDFDTEVQFLKYIMNYCLTRLDAISNQAPAHDTSNATISEHSVPKDESTTNAATILLESAASNDQSNDEMECLAANIKRRVHEDSSDDDIDTNPNKKSASSSPASKRTGTHVSRERGREDPPKISSFPSTPRTGDRRANRGSLSPIRPPSTTSGGSSNNREKPKLPPKPQESRVKTATLTKS